MKASSSEASVLSEEFLEVEIAMKWFDIGPPS